MIFDYSTMEETALEHFKGGENTVYARMFFDGKNRVMLGRLPLGATIGLHTHETSSETVYVVSGTAKFLMDGAEEVVQAGQAHHCPKGHTHMLMNGGAEQVVFFAVVPEQ